MGGWPHRLSRALATYVGPCRAWAPAHNGSKQKTGSLPASIASIGSDFPQSFHKILDSAPM